MAVMVAAAVLLLTRIMLPKRNDFTYDVSRKVRGFYAEPENSLDLVFIGSSNLFSTINPAVLWREYGITSYVFGANEQNLPLSYYYTKEALKHQSPQAVVLDVFYCNFPGMQREAVVRTNLDDMPWDFNKLEAIWNNVPTGERASYLLPIIKYHDRWNDLSKQDFTVYRGRNPYKGWSPFEGQEDGYTKSPEEIAAVMERSALEEEAVAWLDRIAACCEENGAELILLKTPNDDLICLPTQDGGYEEVAGQAYYNAVADLAYERGLSFLNLNCIMQGRGHNDIADSQKVTSYFGSWFLETHETLDKRGTTDYAYWDQDADAVYAYIDGVGR